MCLNHDKYKVKISIEEISAIQLLIVNYGIEKNMLWILPRYFNKFIEMYDIKNILHPEDHCLYYDEDIGDLNCECGRYSENCNVTNALSYVYFEASVDYDPLFDEHEVVVTTIGDVKQQMPPLEDQSHNDEKVELYIDSFQDLRSILSLLGIENLFPKLIDYDFGKEILLSYNHGLSIDIYIRDGCCGSSKLFRLRSLVYKRDLKRTRSCGINKYDEVRAIQCKMKRLDSVSWSSDTDRLDVG